MFTVEHSVVVEIPPRRLYAFLAANDEWRAPTVEDVLPLDPGPVRVGSRFENTIKAAGRRHTVVNRVTVHDPPRRMSWTQIAGAGPVRTVEGNYFLEQVGSATRFTIRTSYEPRGLYRRLAPLVRRITDRTVRRQVARCKVLAEAHEATR